jgi:glycerophosphoryl diester phosphodiesterase
VNVGGRPRRLAHRGDWRRATENSIEAFRAAVALDGCDGIEFDVRGSADGVPVVIHDETLQRVQGVKRRVAGFSAAELASHGVPTLEAVLAACRPTTFLDVELKEDLAEAVIPLLTAVRGDPPRSTVISAFAPATVAAVRSQRPDWPCWLNSHVLGPGTVDLARELGCRAVASEWHAIDARTVATARRAGLEVVAWTVRRRSTSARLADLGVTTIIAEGAALRG